MNLREATAVEWFVTWLAVGWLAAALALPLVSGCHATPTPEQQSRIVQVQACEARVMLAIQRNATRADMCTELGATPVTDPCADHFDKTRKAVCP